MQTLTERAQRRGGRRPRWIEPAGVQVDTGSGHTAARPRRQPTPRWRAPSLKRSIRTAWHGEPVPPPVANFVPFGVLSEDDLQRVFARLADEWERDTALESFPTRAVMHPAYLRMVNMGPRVVPLILGRLQTQARPWFWALSALTRENPAAGTTTFSDAARAWLEWGRQHDLIR
jgi:hypothetical protein